MFPMQPSQRKEFLAELSETEGFIAQRKADIKQKKGSKAPPNLQGMCLVGSYSCQVYFFVLNESVALLGG